MNLLGTIRIGDVNTRLKWFNKYFVPHINVNPHANDCYTLAKTYINTISSNNSEELILWNLYYTKPTIFKASGMIPVNQPYGSKWNFTDFLSVNSNNIKYISMFKNYFNMTYN